MAFLTQEQIAGRKPVQIAFVVDDLEKVAMQWVSTVGAGPFFIARALPITDVRDAAGNPAELEEEVALGQWGSVMVELVKTPRVTAESAREALTAPGFNHIAYFAQDPESEAERLEKAGAPTIISLQFGGVPVHFHDARSTSGFLIEHYPYVDAIEQTYGLVAGAAEGWTGAEPIRSLDG